jgi:hypothetical protein
MIVERNLYKYTEKKGADQSASCRDSKDLELEVDKLAAIEHAQ